MNYTIFIYSKKLESFYKDNIAEFTKRLSRYCKIKIEVLKKEEDLKKKRLKADVHFILTEEKSRLSSENFATMIHEMEVHGISSCNFYIHCTPEALETKPLPISPLSMDEGLLAAILTEQIYRGYRILNGQPYHK